MIFQVILFINFPFVFFFSSLYFYVFLKEEISHFSKLVHTAKCDLEED
jgi:hypothetical protein